jgi:hypothetical protein
MVIDLLETRNFLLLDTVWDGHPVRKLAKILRTRCFHVGPDQWYHKSCS